MKKILFDVDGIFLSEERCFDVSALTVYELLMDKCYLGLHSHIVHLIKSKLQKNHLNQYFHFEYMYLKW
ncbi:HAD family hydrolase, partial [Staphylococcus aureus]|nr:HAD family hydrolase [Staphylococcus aureus]